MTEDFQEFWQQVSDAATRIVDCQTCLQQQRTRKEEFQVRQTQLKNQGKEYKEPQDLGLPQPGWVGPNYRPGMGVVFVLQNPGVGGIRRTGQEAEYQEILLSLTSNHDVDKYTQYVAGTLPMVPGWYMWQRFVGEVVEGCLTVQEIAWLNAVKFRTPDNAGLRANKKRHSLKDHLRVCIERFILPFG